PHHSILWSRLMRNAFLALAVLAMIAAFAPVHADTFALSRTGTRAAVYQTSGGQAQSQGSTIPAGWQRYERPGSGYRVALPGAQGLGEATEERGGVEDKTDQ